MTDNLLCPSDFSRLPQDRRSPKQTFMHTFKILLVRRIAEYQAGSTRPLNTSHLTRRVVPGGGVLRGDATTFADANVACRS